VASPQLDHGHSRLANELLEALIKCPPATVPARQIWDWVWRESWGRKGAMNTRPTSVRDLAEELGLSHGTAGRALEALLATNHAVRNEDGSLSIQKDHERWVLETRQHREPPKPKQLILLEDASVPTAGTKRPHGGDKASPRRGRNRPHGGDETVPTAGTRTIRSLKKERKKESPHPVFDQHNNDTPRTRAEAGDPRRPPEEHPNFRSLGFQRRDELTAHWKENVAKNACRKKCGRTKISATWNYCRECTVCSGCGAKSDSGRKFYGNGFVVTCVECHDGNK
jgi:hypothetical protein